MKIGFPLHASWTTLVMLAVVACPPVFRHVEAQNQRDRGMKARPNQSGRLLTEDEVKELPAKGKRFALVIGADEYQDSQISRLTGATNDARTLADALVRYAGFPADQVILLASDQPLERQPTRGNILQYLSNLKGIVPEDGLLLVSFAGHGIERNGRGFLCPSDARLGGMTLLEATAIPVDTVREWIRETGVKQVLMILDACRNNPSGRGETENKLTDSFAKQFNFDVRNKEVTAFATLYATDVGHVAYEYKEKRQGYFSWWLIEGLKGGAANEKGEVTLGGLVKYLQEQVPKRIRLDMGPEKTQKPYVTVGGYKADDLVISITVNVTSGAGKPPVASVDPATIELEFWNSIKSSSDADDFKEYLSQYSNGRFAGLARNKIRNLEAAAKPASPVSNPPASNSAVTKPDGTKPVSSGVARQEHVDLQTYTEMINRVGIEMVRVPAGRFLMGSPASEEGHSSNESPQHEVGVSSFYMGKYEVTQAQWRAVSGLPKVEIDLPTDPSHFQGDDLPVEQVTWDEAAEFCARLSQATGKTYRLPTEAEWEYAARATTTGPHAGNQDSMAWYESNSVRKTHPVGAKQPNGFGLYDMHGNVGEWCLDWFLVDYYSQSPSLDNSGPSTGSWKVTRGGSWAQPAQVLRSAYRNNSAPGNRFRDLGFRLVRTLN